MHPIDDNTESIRAYSHSSTPMLSMNSSKTDLSDVGLCSLNVHENNYNILLCYLMLGDHAQALTKLNDLVNETPGKYQRHFFLLRGMLFKRLGENERSLKDLGRYEKLEPKAYASLLKDKKDMVFEPFPVKSRLCSRFESIAVPIAEGMPRLLLRPSFSMPFIKPPNMIPNIDEESIQGEFTLKQIDAPMPEAPWIRRWGGNVKNDEGVIKFTDSILQDDEEEEASGNEGPKEEVKKPTGKKPPAALYREEPPEESPYMQSLEVAPRGKTIGGIAEQILKQGKSTVYQVVGDGVDFDLLSDKHKISLFDESRNDDTLDRRRLLAGSSLDAGDSLCDDRLMNSLDDDSSSDDGGSSSEEEKRRPLKQAALVDNSTVLMAESVVREKRANRKP